MTPDELERLPAPQICRTCAHWEQFAYMGGQTRQHCRKGKPQHENCQWVSLKTPSLVADRGQT